MRYVVETSANGMNTFYSEAFDTFEEAVDEGTGQAWEAMTLAEAMKAIEAMEEEEGE